MADFLLDDRARLAAELSEKKAKLARLERELEALQDRKTQARMAEEFLAAHYAGIMKQHPIDRSQEAEIDRTIKEKRAAVDGALKAYCDAFSAADAELREAAVRHETYLYGYDLPSSERYTSYDAFQKTVRAKDKSEVAFYKKLEKERSDKKKAAGKA